MVYNSLKCMWFDAAHSVWWVHAITHMKVQMESCITDAYTDHINAKPKGIPFRSPELQSNSYTLFAFLEAVDQNLVLLFSPKVLISNLLPQEYSLCHFL